MIERIVVKEQKLEEPLELIHLKVQHELSEKYKVFNNNKRRRAAPISRFRDLTSDEVEYIRDNYNTKLMTEIAAHLNISANVIQGRIRRGTLILQ